MIVTILQIPVACGREKDIEDLFMDKKSIVGGTKGIISLEILKPLADNYYLIVSHWESQKHLAQWIGSKDFKTTHNAVHFEFVSGKPKFDIYEII